MGEAGETRQCCAQCGCLGPLLWKLCSETLLAPGKLRRNISHYGQDSLLVLHEVSSSSNDIYVLVTTLSGKTVVNGWCARSVTVLELQQLVGSKMRPLPVASQDIGLVLGSSTMESKECLGAYVDDSCELMITILRLGKPALLFLTLNRSFLNMHLISLPSQEVCRNLRGHKNGILEVFADFEEAHILTKSSDGTVRWWDLCDGICLASQYINSDCTKTLVFADLPKQRALIAHAEAKGASCMKLWDCASNKWLLRWPESTEQHTQVSWNFDILAMNVNWERMLALLSTGGRPLLILVDVMKGTFLEEITLGSEIVDLPSFDWASFRALCITGPPDCCLMLTCLQTGTELELWSPEVRYVGFGGARKWTLEAFKIDVNWPSNRAVLCSELQSNLKVLDLETSATLLSCRCSPMDYMLVDWVAQQALLCDSNAMYIIDLSNLKIVSKLASQYLLPRGYKGKLKVVAVGGSIDDLLKLGLGKPTV